MKALEKDRTRRYATTNDFARDIQRYLHDEAVEACPPSTVYLLRKFTRRHQAAVIATLAVSLALILGAGVATGQAYRATKAEKYAQEQLHIAQEQQRLAKQQAQLAQKQKELADEAARREAKLRIEADEQRDLAKTASEQAEAAREQSEAVTDFLVDIFQSPDPERDGRTITVAEMLGKARSQIETEFGQASLLQAKLLGTIAGTYLSLGRIRESTESAEQAYGILLGQLGPQHPYTLVTMSNVAEGYFATGRRDEALALAEQTWAIEKNTLGEDHPVTLALAQTIARYYRAVGRVNDAIPLLERTMELEAIKLGTGHPSTRSALWLLVDFHVQRDQHAAAETLVLRLLDATPLDATAWYALGLVRLAQGNVAAYQRGCHELITRYVQSAEPPFPGWKLAWCCKLAPIGEEDALQVERLARESYAAAPDDQRARHELACALYRAGKFAESLEHLQALWDNDVPGRVWSGVWLAMVHARMGNAPEAQRYFDLTVEASKEASWPTGSCTALEHELLQREAESLLEPAQTKQDESPAGDGNK